MTSLNDTPGCGWIEAAAGKAIDALHRHLPVGAAWLAWRIPGKTAYLLCKALARAYDDATAYLCKLAAELDPRTAEDMLPEWETALSLPDACLPAVSSLADRRARIMFRLTKRRWSTAQDWMDLAELYGLTITITPGWLVQKPALYAASYPKRYDLFPKLGRFRVYIDIDGLDARGYAYGAPGGGTGYPIPYGINAPAVTAFQCLIARVKPAHVVVIWNDNPLRNGCYARTFEASFQGTFCSESSEF